LNKFFDKCNRVLRRVFPYALIIVPIVSFASFLTYDIIKLNKAKQLEREQELAQELAIRKNIEFIREKISPKTTNYQIVGQSQSQVIIDNTQDTRVYYSDGKIITDHYGQPLSARWKSNKMTHYWYKLRPSESGGINITTSFYMEQKIYYIQTGDNPAEEVPDYYTIAIPTLQTNFGGFPIWNFYTQVTYNYEYINPSIKYSRSNIDECVEDLPRFIYDSKENKYIATKIINEQLTDSTSQGIMIIEFTVLRLEIVFLDEGDVMFMFYEYGICENTNLDIYRALIAKTE
jgi:hypothetical protein